MPDVNVTQNQVNVTPDISTLSITTSPVEVSVQQPATPSVTVDASQTSVEVTQPTAELVVALATGPPGPAGAGGGVTSYSELSDIPVGIISSSLHIFTAITSSGDISSSADLRVRNVRLNDPDGGVLLQLDTSTGDGVIRFRDDGTQKWDIGRDNTNQNFVISTDTGLDTNDVVVLTRDSNISLNGPITASGDISASGDVYAKSILLPFGQALNWGDGGNHIRVDSGIGHIIFDTLPVQMQNGLEVVGVNGHITASGNVIVEGNIKTKLDGGTF